MTQVRIGCSRWKYAHWGEVVYPKGLPQRRWLEHYLTLFDTVEVNATFYRLPTPEGGRRLGGAVAAGSFSAALWGRSMFRVKRAAAFVLAIVAVWAVAAPAATVPFKAALTAKTHTPKVKTKWYYVVTATSRAGKPITARLTMQVMDPTGQVHPVQYASTKKNITNWRFHGRFRDFIIWPADSSLASALGGLVLRATVKADGAKIVLRYRVKPR